MKRDVHHECECGEVTSFAYEAITVLAPSWTCRCGRKVQLPRLPATTDRIERRGQRK